MPTHQVHCPNKGVSPMSQQQQRRRRGVILTPQGLKKLQIAKSEAESGENDDRRYTLENLNIRTGLDPDTLMKVFACEAGVDKRTLNICFRAFNLQLEPNDYKLQAPQFEVVEGRGGATRQVLQDWGEAPDVSVFCGRSEELTTLTHWILKDRCRLVALLGMGGMGKTCLSVKLAEKIQDEFEFVIWRSLRNAPPVKDILAELIQFLSNERETDLPETVDGRVSLLIRYLRGHRTLLVLDDVEKILQGCNRQEMSSNYPPEQYRQGYDGYGEFFKRVGEARHQSCLVLTSRERPKEVGLLEGETLPVRVLQVKGLQVAEVEEMLRAKGSFSASPEEWSQLSEYYAGNPLALKIVSTTIQKLFDGSIAEFLKQNTPLFGDIRNLLDQQFERLSNAEKEMIGWLAIDRQPVSFSQLREKIVPPVPPQQLLEVLESLEKRSLIEKRAALFSLQPVVMEYVTDRFHQEKIA
ncbi:MAG TPA: NB-ARC domain-containing protein [Chroococcales cyanobacterium]